MFHACVQRFDVTGNKKKETKQGPSTFNKGSTE